MESMTLTKRPSMSLTPVCAPAYMAAVAPISRVHQVRFQAELAQVLVRGNSNTVALKGREGFVGNKVSSAKTPV